MATSRVTWALGATTIVAVASTIWLYFDNRTLRADLQNTTATLAAPAPAEAGSATADPWTAAVKQERDARVAISAGDAPALPAAPKESRMDRRARRTMEFGERFAARGERRRSTCPRCAADQGRSPCARARARDSQVGERRR